MAPSYFFIVVALSGDNLGRTVNSGDWMTLRA
jgi:hypothetical protein